MKKFITIATALAISLVAVGSANAQTAEELQAQIAQLQAMIAQLTSQLGTTSTTTTGTTSIPAVCSGITFTRNLTIGSRGADVKCLQALLNQDPATQLAATGAGSPGQETDYFGPITKAAVIKFQEKYASEVLTPLGLTKGTGYVGNATIAKLNSILSSASVVPTTPTYTPTPTPEPYTPPVTGEEEEEEEEEEELSGGEGEVRNFEVLGDPSDEELEEGDSNHKVLGVSFEADGSDLKLNRVKVYFGKKDGDGSYRPWSYFKKVSLYLGDEKIAEKDADQDNWSEYSASSVGLSNKGYSMTFTGLNEIIREGDEAELYVAVTANDDIDSKNENTVWKVWIPENGIRFTDAAGLNVYNDTEADETFTVQESTNATVKLSYETSENGNRVVDVDDQTSTDNVEVLRFKIQSKNNESLLTDLKVNIETDAKTDGASDASNLVSRLKLYKGNTLVKTKTVSSEATSVTFDSIDLTLPEDSKETFTIKADFKAMGTDKKYEGSYIKLTIGKSDLTVENNSGDIISTSGISGTVTGGKIYAFASGIGAIANETKAEGTTGALGAGDMGQATFYIKFTVTAFDDDIYIPVNVNETGVATTTDGFVYELNPSNVTKDKVTLSATISRGGNISKVGNYYKISDGGSGSFTLKVTAVANASNLNGNATVKMDTIKWTTDNPLEESSPSWNEYNYFESDEWETEPASIQSR